MTKIIENKNNRQKDRLRDKQTDNKCHSTEVKSYLTLFASSGCKFGTPLLFSLYLRHSFCSDSEDVEGNRVKEML